MYPTLLPLLNTENCKTIKHSNARFKKNQLNGGRYSEIKNHNQPIHKENIQEVCIQCIEGYWEEGAQIGRFFLY